MNAMMHACRGMVESGIHAVVAKVAALGLDPRKHLGRSIAALEPHLHHLNQVCLWQYAVAGMWWCCAGRAGMRAYMRRGCCGKCDGDKGIDGVQH